VSAINIQPSYEVLAALCGHHVHLVDRDDLPVLALRVDSVVHDETTHLVTAAFSGPARHPLPAGVHRLRTNGRDLWLHLEPVADNDLFETYVARFDQPGESTRSITSAEESLPSSTPATEVSSATSRSSTGWSRTYATS
jgi:hypothetical protein